jgi:hypothetical protein
MTWLRRIYEGITAPAVSLLDVMVVGFTWGTALSDYSKPVKLVVIVVVLAIGGSSFLFRNQWWRPKPRCEVKNCPNRSGGQTCATDPGSGVAVYRRVCDEHWGMWRKPDGEHWGVAEERDELMRQWGWPGESWFRD